MGQYDAVLLIGFGGPANFGEVRSFLDNVTRARAIPKERYDLVLEQYRAIGGRSPYLELTQRQAQALMTLLRADGCDLHVYIGMRNWHPFLGETLLAMANDAVRQAIGIILSPFHSEASWQRYREAVDVGRARLGMSAPEITYISDWHLDPFFIGAIAERIREALSNVPKEFSDDLFWIFTAHSIPAKMNQESGYSKQITNTAAQVAKQFDNPPWTLAFQSRSGKPQEPWLEPDIGAAIQNLARKKVRAVLVIPIGFLHDHVEVLYDLDVKAKAMAQACGVAFFRVPTVGDHPQFITMLADKVLALRKAQP